MEKENHDVDVSIDDTSIPEEQEEKILENEPEYLTYQQVVEEQSERAEEYHSITVKLEWTNKIYTILLVLFLILIRFPNYLRDLSPFGQDYSFLNVGFVLVIFFLVMYLAGLPFTVYSEKIERDFEFSTKTNRKFITDQLKSLGLGLVIILVVIEAIFAAIHYQPNIWWLYGFVGYFIFAGVLQTLSPWILSLFTKIESLEEGDVRSVVERLAEDMDLKYDDIYRWDLSDQTTKANAAVTGFGSSIRIILGDTLINNFRNDEIEVVMAHEIAHQQNNDIYRGMVFTGLISLIAFLFVDLGYNTAISTLGLTGMDDPAAIGYFMFAVLLALEILSSLQLWYTRRREKAADLVSIDQTKDITAFESAFARLSKQNLSYPNPSKLEIWLRYSHPPIRERVRYGKEFIQEIES